MTRGAISDFPLQKRKAKGAIVLRLGESDFVQTVTLLKPSDV